MRVATAALLLTALALLAGAAYLGPAHWEQALYADGVAWTLTALFALALAGEALLPARAWGPAAVALLAGAGAAGASLRTRPGALAPFPFHELARSAVSVGALGLAVGGVLVGAAAVRGGRRAPAALGGLAMLLCGFALRGWLRG